MMYYLLAIASILGVWCLHLYLKWRREIYYHMEMINGPKTYPFIGTSYYFFGAKRNDIFKIRKSIAEKYKPFFRTWNGMKPEIHLMKPEHFELIMGNSVHITKGYIYNFVKPWLRDGLLISTGTKWHQRRKMITPTFHYKILEHFMETFKEKTKILLADLEKKTGNEIFDVYPYITYCALDIICETAMGVKINAMLVKNSTYIEALYQISELVIKRIMTPFLHSNIFYIFPKGKQFQSNLNILHGFTQKVISQRKEKFSENSANNTQNIKERSSKQRLSFLDLLLDASKNDNSLSELDIREEVDTFMFEGHDTTTAAICWTIFLLANHPDIQEKVHAEVRSVLQDRDIPQSITDLNKFKYLECCVKEALRLYPSVPFISRRLAQDITIDGFKVPKGVYCNMHIHQLHRDPEIYPNPEKFDPDRFLPENCSSRHPFAYVPFSAGPRNCIGQKFAMYEEKTILASIVRSFKIIAVDTLETISVIAELILRPEQGLKIILERRHDQKYI